jgi:hypothetical protein
VLVLSKPALRFWNQKPLPCGSYEYLCYRKFLCPQSPQLQKIIVPPCNTGAGTVKKEVRNVKAIAETKTVANEGEHGVQYGSE